MTMAAAHANPPVICRNTQEWTTKVSDISPLPLRNKSIVSFCVKTVTWMNRRVHTMKVYRCAGSIAISTTLDLRIGIMFMAKARSKITLIMLSIIGSLSFVMLPVIPTVPKRVHWPRLWKIQRTRKISCAITNTIINFSACFANDNWNKFWVRSFSSILYSCKGNHVMLESSVGETVNFQLEFPIGPSKAFINPLKLAIPHFLLISINFKQAIHIIIPQFFSS